MLQNQYNALTNWILRKIWGKKGEYIGNAIAKKLHRRLFSSEKNIINSKMQQLCDPTILPDPV